MLISCNPRCKKSDGRTDGSLDVERNEVVCKICGDDVVGISSFTKLFAATTELCPIEILFETNEPMPKKHFSPVVTLPANMVPGAKKFWFPIEQS